MSVGQSPIRHDAAAKTDGTIEYAGDAVPADALHAVVVFSGKAHARMVSMSTDAARAMPGVVDATTAGSLVWQHRWILQAANGDSLGVREGLFPRTDISPKPQNPKTPPLCLCILEERKRRIEDKNKNEISCHHRTSLRCCYGPARRRNFTHQRSHAGLQPRLLDRPLCIRG